MLRIDDHGNTLRVQRVLDRVRDLSRHLFLNLQALCIDFHDTGQLRNANDTVLRQIRDMGRSDDWDHVVLAMAFEGDIPKQDHLVIAFGFLEGPRQHLGRILRVTGEELLIGANNAIRRVDQPLAVRVVACPAQQRTHRGFRVFP